VNAHRVNHGEEPRLPPPGADAGLLPHREAGGGQGLEKLKLSVKREYMQSWPMAKLKKALGVAVPFQYIVVTTTSPPKRWSKWSDRAPVSRIRNERARFFSRDL
jgi:hypothetical protein